MRGISRRCNARKIINLTLAEFSTERSIHSPDAWYWSAEKIEQYIHDACMDESILRRRSVSMALRERIWPFLLTMKERGDPYVTTPCPGGEIVSVLVPASMGGSIPITDFCSALGYVISSTEKPGSSNPWFFRTVALYARWCYTMFGSASWFGRQSRLPNTAHIIWAKSNDGDKRADSFCFSLATTLPETILHPRSHKNKARLVRVQALESADQKRGVFSLLTKHWQHELGTQPRYQWGNCAETMNLLSLLAARESYGLAIQLKPVARMPHFQSLDSLTGKTRFACHRCQALVETAGHKHYDLRFIADHETIVEEADQFASSSNMYYHRLIPPSVPSKPVRHHSLAFYL